MSEELTMDQKMAMVREAKPSYAKNELIEKWQEAGRMINSERREEARKDLMQSVLFDKTVGTKINLHDPLKPLPTDGGGVAAQTGAFFTVYDDGGHKYLQGGQVSAGSGTVTVADFKVYDSGTGWVGTAGQHLCIRANGTGDDADGVLMPVFNLTTVDGPAALASVPAPDLPAIGDLSGGYSMSLGVFTSDSFLPSNIGNIQVSFCFGGFTASRF